MIPTRLDDWTREAIEAVAVSGVNENDIYDFKADLQPADHQRKSVAAFANTRGGFLIFGVTNDRKLEGVPNAELPRDFGVKLKAGLEPSVEYRFSAPLEVSPGRNIFVVEVPRSLRGPHAVSINGTWTFLKRTAAGNCDPMTYEEIREMFLDAGRRQNELAWLRAEADRILDLAKRINQEASAGVIDDATLVLTRFDIAQLRTLMVSVFGYIGRNKSLVDYLHMLVERCSRVDAMLATATPLVLLPRDRSYSGSSHDWRSLLRSNLPQIAIDAGHVVRMLEQNS